MSRDAKLLEDEVGCRADESAPAGDPMLDILEAACPPGACFGSFLDELTGEVFASGHDSFITDSFDPAAGTPQQVRIVLHEENFWLALTDAAEKRLV